MEMLPACGPGAGTGGGGGAPSDTGVAGVMSVCDDGFLSVCGAMAGYPWACRGRGSGEGKRMCHMRVWEPTRK
jgi:hypothetical protein